MQLTVGTFNIEHLGWALGKGHHRLGEALDFLLFHTPEPPDILALPEATHCLDDGQFVLRSRVVYPLSQRLSDGWYEPLYASHGVPYQRNHHSLLLVNTAKVKPTRWHDSSGVLAASKRLSGFAEVEVFGHTLLVCCEHWRGGEGREEFFRAAHRVSTHGGPVRKTLLLGDFNTTSGWSEEHLPADWYERCQQRGELGKLAQKGWKTPDGRWEIDTRQMDLLLNEYGYRDMGQEWGDPTPTTHPEEGSALRIDRIITSVGFPGRPVEYQVRQPPRHVSDHAYVFGTYDLTPPAA